VAWTDTESASLGYLSKFDITYPNGPDLGTRISQAFRTTGVPETYIIDKNGVLVYNGAVDSDPRGNSEKRIHYVEDALKALAAGKEIGTHSTTPYGCSVKY